jgi:hypothetical protein
MKSKSKFSLLPILFVFFTFFIDCNLEAQEKSKKQLKEEQKLEKQKQIALLVESKEFVFIVNRVMPQSGRTINLTTEYSVEFHSERIKCDLPFFGRAYSGAGYGGTEGGIIFEEIPTDYSIEKKEKKYLIRANVRGDRDSYSMILTVYFEGSATLSVNSNNRSPISYDGNIESFKKNDKTNN